MKILKVSCGLACLVIIAPSAILAAFYALVSERDWPWFFKFIIKDDLRRLFNPLHTLDVILEIVKTPWLL